MITEVQGRPWRSRQLEPKKVLLWAEGGDVPWPPYLPYHVALHTLRAIAGSVGLSPYLPERKTHLSFH